MVLLPPVGTERITETEPEGEVSTLNYRRKTLWSMPCARRAGLSYVRVSLREGAFYGKVMPMVLLFVCLFVLVA